MQNRTEAIISPEILKWARERIGLDPDVAAKKIGVTKDKLTSWEKGKKRPSVKQLYTLAEKYSQPPAVFYLSEIPADEPLPHDFRQVSDIPGYLDPALIKEIRRVQRLREEALGLLEEFGEKGLRSYPSVKLSEDPEEVSEKLREALKVSLREQFDWRDNSIARKTWTEKIEQLGILVFSSERINLNIFRGVSIGGAGIPVILLNGQDSDAGRIFTLLHELAHLAINSAGVCIPLDSPLDEKTIDSKTEFFCNRVASATLMPKRVLLEESEVNTADRKTEWPEDKLSPLALRYSVSQEAMLLRLLELGKTNQSHYFARRKEFYKEYELYRVRKKEKSAPVPYKYRVLNRIGRAYAKLVLNALYEDLITTADVASLTGINLKHMGPVEEELFGRAIIFRHGA
jgi:Zn-dependent peptidase ImmA (M78 family)/DNA-binding XRE family transcriptional regulator